MKPRTKREIEVVKLHKKLGSLDGAKKWARENLFKKNLYVRNPTMWCTECGHSWKDDKCPLYYATGGDVECPHCHTKLTSCMSRKMKDKEEVCMTVPATCHGYQVFRHVISVRYARIGEEAVYDFHEIVQEWIDAQGKRTIMAVARNMNYGWNYNHEMSIKSAVSSYYVQYGDYRIDGNVCNGGRLLPELRKRGLTRKILNSTIPSLVSEWLMQGNCDIELVIKTGQMSMLHYMVSRRISILPYKHAFNICNRNHYMITDATMWYDYLSMLDYFHKDTHNAHYVCPDNMNEVHDRLMTKKQRIEAEEAKRKEAEEAKEREEAYRLAKGRYFGLCFTGYGMIIRVIKTVHDMFEEGTAMRHCVYTMKYYDKPDSLIMSARDENTGERIETIEVNLKTFKVVQSRAKCNMSSSHHDDILKLMKEHMNEIRKAKKSKRKKKHKLLRAAV